MSARTLSNLEDLGLDREEAEVYVLLVREGSGTVGHISGSTGHSRTKVYSIVDRLVSKGWIKVIVDKPKTCAPLDPSKVISERKESMTASVESAMSELAPLFDRSKVEVGEILTYQGPQVQRKILEIVSEAERGVDAVMTYVSLEKFDVLVDGFRNMAEAGIKLRAVMSDKYLERKEISELKDRVLFRFAKLPRFGMMIVDCREVVFGNIESENVDPEHALALWTNNKEMVSFSQFIFDVLFDNSRGFDG